MTRESVALTKKRWDDSEILFQTGMFETIKICYPDLMYYYGIFVNGRRVETV